MIESAQRVKYETLRTLAFGSVTNNYVAVGSQFQNSVRILSILNTTNQTILVSFNGVDDMDAVAGPGSVTYDYGANSILPVGKLEQSAYTQLYVKTPATLPTSGSVYVTIIYASAS